MRNFVKDKNLKSADKVCEKNIIHENTHERHAKLSERGRISLQVTYVLAVCLPFLIFFMPIPGRVERFGALLILVPTIVTGMHVFIINTAINELDFSLSNVTSGGMCGGCEKLFHKLLATKSVYGSNLRMVIIVETILASVGTFIWAFGGILDIT